MSQSNGTEQKPANALAAMHFARDALRVVSVTGSVANPGRAEEISRDLEAAGIAVAELIIEVRTLLRNAEFEDGQGVILTQDAEAVERVLARVGDAP